MIFTEDFLNELSSRAKANPRLRQNYDLRNSDADGSQRMLNALEPGTVLPIHRHLDTSESLAVIRGSIEERFYDDEGNLTSSVVLRAGVSPSMLHIPAREWHSLVCLEPGTILFESKDGAYRPLGEDEIL